MFGRGVVYLRYSPDSLTDARSRDRRSVAWELPLLRLVPFPHQQGELPRSPTSSRKGNYAVQAFGNRVFDMIHTHDLGKLDDLNAVQSSPAGPEDVSEGQEIN